MPITNAGSLKRRFRASAAAALIAVLAAAILIAGCGGGSSKKTTTTATKTSSTSSTQTTTTPAKPKPKPKLTQDVRVATSKTATFGATGTGKAGDEVQFRTVVPGKSTGKPVPVDMTIDQSGTKITVTSKAKGQTSTATLSTGSTPLKLNGVHYNCVFPPAPTFCPARNLKTPPSGYTLQFSTRPRIPVTLIATLAKSAAAPSHQTKTSTGAVVPPYLVSVKVRSVTPSTSGGKSTASAFGPSATVHPDDLVVAAARVSGKLSGAPQKLTLTIAQGPGTSMAVTASVPGGAPAHATITSGSKVALVLGRYGCYLPPYPTFCPPEGATVSNKQYKMTVKVTPASPQVVILTEVQKA